jgi:Arc/MetJ family transcription regulator
MAKTLVDIDEGALRLAMAEFGTTTKVETVNRALTEVAERRRRSVDEFMAVALEISRNLGEIDAQGVSSR